MDRENKSVHDFDVNLICEYYSNFTRQGPGSPEITIKALSFIDNLNGLSQIADIGCGTGGQTIVLAQHTTGNIIGIDLAPIMIEKFNNNVMKNNLQNRVKGLVGSMDKLSFKNEELDMILSEGAIYNIGFERGLNEWNKYIKQGGYLVVSEASWFTEDRPSEITDFWMDAYPEIDTIPGCISKMQKAGYIPIASFIIPEYCWTDNFYVSHVSFQDVFLNKYAGNKTVEEFIAYERYEAQMYNKYKKYYGYVFYIGKKI
jgi:SAM-dependent methyltransferase